MTNWWRDVRYGFRMLANNKVFTAVAILALALGIGPNVAMFSVIWATFFAPSQSPDEQQMVVVWTKIKGERNASWADDYLQYLAQSKSFQHLDFLAWVETYLTNTDASEEPVSGQVLTPGFWSKDSVTPMALGRDFLPDEGIPGNEHEVILDHQLWMERYHGDPNILGKQIRIDAQPYTVVGVLKAGPSDDSSRAFTIPFAPNQGGHDPHRGNIFGRLKPGVTIAQVQAELSLIDRRLAVTRANNLPKDAWTVSVEPLRNDWLDKKSERGLWLLLAAVGFVLLIACANVANLLLARGGARQKEIAVRAAVGASRRQVFAQLLTESLTLAIFGGVVGIAFGWALLKLVVASLAGSILQVTDASTAKVNLPILLFATGMTVLSGILFGCAPAWHAAKLNLSDTLKQGSQPVIGGRRSRTQAALVVAEFALAITLLAGAGMALHSFWKLSRIDLGIRTDHLLIPGLATRSNTERPTAEQINIRARQLLGAVRALPGVLDAALTTTVPLQGYDSDAFSIVGRPIAETDNPVADFEVVTPSYFNTFGVRLIKGRLLNDGDDQSSPPVVVVSECFVRRYLQHIDPLGQSILRPHWLAPKQWQIVGVFGDVSNGERLSEQAAPTVLGSFWQIPPRHPALVVRTALDPSVVTKSIRRAVAAAAPAMVVTHVQTMDQIVSDQIGDDRFVMVLFGGFAALALLLAALGIYGVMGFAVAQRRHEIGLRMALGAQKHEIVRMILTDGMKLAVLGVGIGLVGVYALGRLMRSTLYGINTVDFGSFAAVAFILLAAAITASYVPALRSANVDPMTALRQE